MKLVDFHGMPVDWGTGVYGSRLGPSAFRNAPQFQKLRELCQINDHGEVFVETNAEASDSTPSQKHFDLIAPACKTLSDRVYQSLLSSRFPFVVGGDHSLAMGSIAGSARYFFERDQRLGVVWFDAHGDINTPATTLTGHLHGMPLAFLLGQCFPELAQSQRAPFPAVRAENTVIVGARDLDPLEKEIIERLGVRFFSPLEIEKRGIAEITSEAVKYATTGTSGFHLSFDMDWIDPQLAPGVSTNVAQGALLDDAMTALSVCARSGQVRAFEIVELNPHTDVDSRTVELSHQFAAKFFTDCK